MLPLSEEGKRGGLSRPHSHDVDALRFLTDCEASYNAPREALEGERFSHLPLQRFQPHGTQASIVSLCASRPHNKTPPRGLLVSAKAAHRYLSSVHKTAAPKAAGDQRCLPSRKATSGCHYQQRPAIQPIVLVSDPKLKKELEFKLKKQHRRRTNADQTPKGAGPSDALQSMLRHPPSEDEQEGKAAEKDKEPPTDCAEEAREEALTGCYIESKATTQDFLMSGKHEYQAQCEDANHHKVLTAEREMAKLASKTKNVEECSYKDGIPVGAARAEAAGLQLVRVFRRQRGSEGGRDVRKNLVEVSRVERHDASRNHPVRASDPSVLWENGSGSDYSQSPKRSSACSKCTQPSCYALQQGREKESCTFVLPETEVNHECGTCSLSTGDRASKTGRNTQCVLPLTTQTRCMRGESSTASAVRQLDEAQKLEERRLHLLEVSHQAIAKQAEDRKKELELQQKIRQLVS